MEKAGPGADAFEHRRRIGRFPRHRLRFLPTCARRGALVLFGGQRFDGALEGRERVGGVHALRRQHHLHVRGRAELQQADEILRIGGELPLRTRTGGLIALRRGYPSLAPAARAARADSRAPVPRAALEIGRRTVDDARHRID